MSIRRKTASTAEFEWPIIMDDGQTFPALVTVGDDGNGGYMCCIEDSSNMSKAYDVYDGYPSLEEAVGAALSQFDVDSGEKSDLVEFAASELRGAGRKTALTSENGLSASKWAMPVKHVKRSMRKKADYIQSVDIDGEECDVFVDMDVNGQWEWWIEDDMGTEQDISDRKFDTREDAIADFDMSVYALRKRSSMRKQAEGSWDFDDDVYSITVDDFDVELIKSFSDGTWFFDVNDFDGYNATTNLFGQLSPYFDTPQEAVDWANDNVNWIGDWKFPRIATRKRRSMRKRAVWDWQPDDGYSGEDTHYEGDYAFVVFEDGGEWWIQVFDTADEEALMYGETFRDFGPYWDEATAKAEAERWGDENGMYISRKRSSMRKRYARKKAASGAKRRVRKARR